LRRREGIFPEKTKKLPKPLDDANGSGYKLLSRPMTRFERGDDEWDKTTEGMIRVKRRSTRLST
jgi:hypothetical protein